MKKQKNIIKAGAVAIYCIFLLASFAFGFAPGERIGKNFISFFIEMLKVLPSAFILIGLFEVWVKKETVERHLGKESGLKGYLWAVFLAGSTVGGLYVAFPVAYSLYSKGANIRIIFTYIGASAVCRIPMIIFEASFLGVQFSLIRLFVSLPLVIVSSIYLGNYFEKNNCTITGAHLEKV